MLHLRSPIAKVYNGLGQILDQPESFGLGKRAPQALIDVVTTMRRSLMEELSRQRSFAAGEDRLEAELSQDADTRCHLVKRG